MKPMVLPSSDARRGASCPPGGAFSGVGSRTRNVICHLLSFLRGFAIDTGADRQGHGTALVAEPGRNHRAEAARRPAGGDDQELIGRWQPRIHLVAAVAYDRAFADVGPFAAMDARALVDEVADVVLAPLRRLQGLAHPLGRDQLR